MLKLTGQEWSVRVEKSKDSAPKPVATDAPKANEPAPLRNKDLMDLPLFKAAAEALGAQIVKVDPGFNPLAMPAATPDAVPVDPLDLPTDDED